MTTGSEPLSGRAAQRHRLALLALLAAQPRGCARDRLVACLWPESDTQHARNLLSQALTALRGALGPAVIVVEGEWLRLDPAAVEVDVLAFRRACEASDWERAVRAWGGPFLDGFFLAGSVEFEQWVAEQRMELEALHAAALQHRAGECAARGDHAGAVAAWRRLAVLDPLSSRVALGFMHALAEAGDRAAAIRHAASHARLLRAELAADPDPDVVALAERLRAAPSPAGPASTDGPRSAGGAVGAGAAVGAGDAAVADPAAVPLPAAPDAGRPRSGPVPARDGGRGGGGGRGAGGDRAVRRQARRLPVAAVTLLPLVLASGMFAYAATRRATIRAPADPAGLAVLPFHVLGPGGDDGGLGIGLADAVITRLSASAAIRVRPTAAILPFEHHVADLRRAARTLEVEHLLTGAIQRTPAGLRASVQLISMPAASPMWGREYVLPESALAALPDSIAAQVALVLRAEGRGTARPAVDARAGGAAAGPAAYALYLRGRSRLARQREAEVRGAIADFEAVIATAPDFAPAWAGLARASAEMHLRFAATGETAYWGQRAAAAARRALELDETLAEGYEALAAVHRKTEFDWEATIDAAGRALALNPSAALPYFYIGSALYHQGLLPQAERAVRRGLEVQPGSDRAEALRTLATVAIADGRFAEAVTLLQDVQRLTDQPVSDPNLAIALHYLGEADRAEQLLVELLGSTSASAASRARATLAGLAAAAGRRQEAVALLADAERGSMDHHVAYGIAAAHAQLGNTRQAVRWLRLAADTGFRCYPWFRRDPLLDPLRGSPEFQALMRELRTAWEAARRSARGTPWA